MISSLRSLGIPQEGTTRILHDIESVTYSHILVTHNNIKQKVMAIFKLIPTVDYMSYSNHPC